MPELVNGDTIAGYRIEEKVARGGMGTVYRARHLDLDRTVAIKVLREDLGENEDVVLRFLREGRLIAKLKHPGIINIFDLGKDQGRYYLVMEFVEGRDLLKVIKEEGPLSEGQVLRVARQVADALDYAHREGIVHRDIKPSNILLLGDGQTRLMDFGIARLLEQETNITNPGSLLGTPVYMSPEQCRAEPVDGRADLYSLGASMYILLSGKPPFSGKIATTLVNQIVNESPTPLNTVVKNGSPEVVGLVKRLMAKHAGARFQTGKELAKAIDRILAGKQVLTVPSLERPLASESFLDFMSIVKFACIGSVLLAAFVALYFFRSQSRESDAASRRETTMPTSTDPGYWRGERPLPRGHSDFDPEALEEVLESRVAEFQDVLLRGEEDAALTFVHPRYHKNSLLLISLGRMVQAVSQVGAGVTGEYSFSSDEDKADVIYTFGPRDGGSVVHFTITWVRRGTQWYIHPRRREQD